MYLSSIGNLMIHFLSLLMVFCALIWRFMDHFSKYLGLRLIISLVNTKWFPFFDFVAWCFIDMSLQSYIFAFYERLRRCSCDSISFVSTIKLFSLNLGKIHFLYLVRFCWDLVCVVSDWYQMFTFICPEASFVTVFKRWFSLLLSWVPRAWTLILMAVHAGPGCISQFSAKFFLFIE